MVLAPSSEAACWKQLYEPATPTEKIQVASSLLSGAAGNLKRQAIWLYEWLCSGAGVLSKKVALPPSGVILLCDLLEALPPAYLLVPSTPLLVAQLRVFTTTFDKEAGQNSAPGEIQGLLSAHLRLLSLLLARSVESFRPSVEQVLPLLTAAAGHTAAMVTAQSCSSDVSKEVHDMDIPKNRLRLLLVAALARMLGRSLEYVNAKKAFKTVLDALPAVAVLASKAPEDALPSFRHDAADAAQLRTQQEENSAVTTEAWPQVLSAIVNLLLALVEQRHLDGYGVLARLAGLPATETQEPSQKRAKKEKGHKAEESGPGSPGSAYQASLFRCIGELLHSADSRDGCLALLPTFFKAFVLQYRRHTVFRGAGTEDAATLQEASSVGARKRPAPQTEQPTVPCEFWFFLQLSGSFNNALHATKHREAVPLVRCLVTLWRLVREHGVYRPREDPKRVQAGSLDSFCKSMLSRLTDDTGRSRAAKRKAASWAPEWDGLNEALALDPSPFEGLLDQMWCAIGDLCPEAGSKCNQNGESHASASDAVAGSARDHLPCVRLAVALLHTYARLADLQSCLEALSSSLRAAPRRRAACLLADVDFLRGLEAAATEVSVGSASSQAMAVWKALLSELDGDRAEVESLEGAEDTWWAAKLLQHIVHGIKVQELAVEPFRDLLLRSFSFFTSKRSRKLPELHRDGLVLSFCIFGRRLLVWDLPRVLRRPEDEGAALRQEVARGLRDLACRLAWAPEAPAPESWEPYVRASVQWLAFLEQESGGLAAKVEEPVATAVESGRIVSGLFQLAMPARTDESTRHRTPSPEAQLEARRSICCWVALLTAYAVRCDKKADDEERKCLSPLVNVLVPKQLPCWRYLARIWDDDQLAAVPLEADKLWGPAAALWAERVDVLVDQPVLREPILQRLTGLIQEAAADSECSAGKRAQLRQCSALLGLVSALLRVLEWARQAVSSELLLPLIDAVAAAGMLACDTCRGQNDEEGSRVAERLLAVVLHCLSSLLAPVAFAGPNLDVAVAEKAVRVLAGAGDAERSGAQTLTAAVASLLAMCSPVASADQLAAALASLSCTLLRQRVRSWPLQERKQWLAALVKRLVAPALASSCTTCGDGSFLEICVPSPQGLLASGESTHSVEPALRLLLAFVQASGPSTGATGDTSASLEGALQISLSAAPDLQWPPEERISDQQSWTAGLVLAVLAQCEERTGRRGHAASAATTRQQTLLSFRAQASIDNTASGQRQEMLNIIAAMLRCLEADEHKHFTDGEGQKRLRLGVSSLLGALCASWPVAEDDDLWRMVLVPLALKWTEISEVPKSKPSDDDASRDVSLHQSYGKPSQGDVTHSCEALCAGVGRDRREYVVEGLARHAALFAMRCTEDTSARSPALLAIIGGLARVLRGMPHRPPLRIAAASEVIIAVHGLLALGASGPHARFFSGCIDDYACFLLCISDVVLGLYVHLAAPLQHGSRAIEKKEPHRKLADAEALLLRLAGLLARSALQLSPGQASERSSSSGVAKVALLNATQFEDLATAAYGLMSALFSAVPAEGGARLPTWTRKPHVVLDVLKALLESVYTSMRGAQAARIASDTARLWEAYAQGGTRMVAQSAGRTGQSTYQAKVQRATRGFVIMLIAHALEQQRRWAGVEAAAQRCLRPLQVQQPDAREAARNEELARWKEAVTVLEQGMVSLLTSLEGSEHLKQSLYAGLREPLSTMFKELHENYQKHSRYQGKA